VRISALIRRRRPSCPPCRAGARTANPPASQEPLTPEATRAAPGRNRNGPAGVLVAPAIAPQRAQPAHTGPAGPPHSSAAAPMHIHGPGSGECAPTGKQARSGTGRIADAGQTGADRWPRRAVSQPVGRSGGACVTRADTGYNRVQLLSNGGSRVASMPTAGERPPVRPPARRPRRARRARRLSARG